MFKNLKVATKLLIGFGIMIAAFLVFAVYESAEIDNLGNEHATAASRAKDVSSPLFRATSNLVF